MININKNLKVLRENPVTGASTVEASEELYELVCDYLREVHGEHAPEVIQGFRRNVKSNVTFRCDGGYHILDAGLLGGNGDDKRLEGFLIWLIELENL